MTLSVPACASLQRRAMVRQSGTVVTMSALASAMSMTTTVNLPSTSTMRLTSATVSVTFHLSSATFPTLSSYLMRLSAVASAQTMSNVPQPRHHSIQLLAFADVTREPRLVEAPRQISEQIPARARVILRESRHACPHSFSTWKLASVNAQ